MSIDSCNSMLRVYNLRFKLVFTGNSTLVKRVNSKRKAIIDETMWIRVDNCAVLLTNLPTILNNIDLPCPVKNEALELAMSSHFLNAVTQ